MIRRTFLKGTVAGIALSGLQTSATAERLAVAGKSALSQADFPSDDYEAPEWLRYARTVLFDGYSPPVYPHTADFDARRIAEDVKRVGANLLRFQPIGYWAYYPSKTFRVHPELGNRDLIDEISRECRKADIHFYCYTGYGHPHMELGWADQHPKYAEWVLRNPDGKPYGTYWHIGWANRQRVCSTGDAYRDGMRQVVRELCEHDIDGIYIDAPSAFGYTGVCFCDSCRINFKKFSGMDIERLASLAALNGLPFSWGDTLPAGTDVNALTAWYAWANEMTRQDLLDYRKIIHGSGKFMLCHNGHSWHGSSLPFQYHIPDGFMVEASIEIHERLMTGLMGASMARPHKKLAQMYVGGYSLTNFNQPQHEHPWVVHNTNLEDADEILMEGFTNLACGNAPIYGTSNRLYFGVGGGTTEPAKEVFELMQRVEPFLKDSKPVPYMTIVPTFQSMQLWQTRRKSWNWPMMSAAMGLAMLDERISFDVNPSTEMTEEWLQRQRVICLCGASGISQDDTRKLSAWVREGGSLLATYDTGLYDKSGKPRQDGGALQEVLGVELRGEPLESQPECYYRIQSRHAALEYQEKGFLIQGDGRLMPVKVQDGAQVLADCWNLGTKQSRGPAIVSHTYGKGRTIYVAGSLEAYYYASRVASVQHLLGSLVKYLGSGAPQPFHLTAPRGTYGVLRQATNGDMTLWILANVGFKDADIGRMRQEFIPITDVEVRILVPDGKRAKSMRLLRSDTNVNFHQSDGYAITVLPKVYIAEIVHLELE